MSGIKDLLQVASGRFGLKKETNNSALLLSQIRRTKRDRIRKHWNVDGLAAKQRASLKRAIRTKVNEYLRPIRKQRRRLTRDEQVLLLRGKRPSRILDRIFPRRMALWLKLVERDAQNELPEIEVQNFSLLHDPYATLNSLKKIAAAEASAPGAMIHFRDEYCLDVAPFMILAECWNEMLPIFQGGEMSLPMQKVLAAVGVQHALGIGLNGVSEFSNVWAFPLMRRRGAGSTQSSTPFLDAQTREFASDRFCDALNLWLSHPEIGISLNSHGIAKIKNLLGELLENAERHSDGNRRDGSWAVSGFMARRRSEDAEEWVYRAHLGIVSIGDSFSESLDRALPDVQRALDDYVYLMKSKGAPQSEKTLRTLAALQDGVTCAADADEDQRGGFGLQEMLEIVSLLGETSHPDRSPRVTILSGSSCIRLRKPYLRGEPKETNDPTRVLWCNSMNSKDNIPDPSYVFDLEPGLPGTVISVGFVLDPDYLKAVTAGENDE
ncbi:hypothetical protein [Hyphococcus sp. DH-69]|uniref:hypothetical protein n=1 Tax=Hyphococcus formosus TaxID=3143534 RepID=UPI00398A8C3E